MGKLTAPGSSVVCACVCLEERLRAPLKNTIHAYDMQRAPADKKRKMWAEAPFLVSSLPGVGLSSRVESKMPDRAMFLSPGFLVEEI